LAFGAPTRYIQLPLSSLPPPSDSYRKEEVIEGRLISEEDGKHHQLTLDEAIAIGNEVYSQRMHNLCCDNCHSHVALILDELEYKNCSSWNMVILAFWMFFFGTYVGWKGVIKTWLPFCIILSIFLLIH